MGRGYEWGGDTNGEGIRIGRGMEGYWRCRLGSWELVGEFAMGDLVIGSVWECVEREAVHSGCPLVHFRCDVI